MNTNENKLKTWSRVDLCAIAHNFEIAKKTADTRVIAVVKANAYGHGAVPVAKAVAKAGCDFFAVSSIEEALELRQGGIGESILILGYVLPCHILSAVENDISFACASLDFAKVLCGIKTDKKMKIHIKLNTGMNRTGFVPESPDFKEALELIKVCEKIEIEGVFSHFAKAESDAEFSALQYDRFALACDYMEKCGIKPKIKHVCNSAGNENYPGMHHDAVRVGIHLYGCESKNEDVLAAMDFCTRIVDIHTIKRGEGVSYGLDYVADCDRTIAVIGAGYADGVFRSLSNGKGSVLVKNKECPIIGRVCMDMTMIDITGAENVNVGDEVVIWGKKHSVEKQAANAGTISYELMCALSPRVKRTYVGAE